MIKRKIRYKINIKDFLEKIKKDCLEQKNKNKLYSIILNEEIDHKLSFLHTINKKTIVKKSKNNKDKKS